LRDWVIGSKIFRNRAKRNTVPKINRFFATFGPDLKTTLLTNA